MKTTAEYPYKVSVLDAAIQATWYVNLICHYVRSAAYSKTVLVSWCAKNRHILTAPEHLLTAPEDL